MRIVIVGAGAVGSSLAERLSGEGQDVVIIEADRVKASEVQETHDALVINGNGSSQSVLMKAEVDKADLLIAVSNNDGANILACHTAKALGVERTVARVEDPSLHEGLETLGVDVVINTGEAGARELVGLVGQAGVSDLVQFANGKLSLIGGTVQGTSVLAGRSLAESRRLTDWEWVLTAVVRDGITTVAHGQTVIEEGDHILVMVTADDAHRVGKLIGLAAHPIRRVFIVGSTRLAVRTVEHIVNEGFDVIVIDSDRDRCRTLAEQHPRPLFVCGDPTDPETYTDFDPSERDMLLALTGWDEINIVACLVAKAQGMATTVARFSRIEYVALLSGRGIDAAVSSRLAAANAILRFVRRGLIHSVATFKDTTAEAIEIEAEPHARLIGKAVKDLALPSGAVIGGLLRDNTAKVPDGLTVIEPRDHLIIFAVPSAIPEVERLFT
jgi:trk system potassium uptake protein TrkA